MRSIVHRISIIILLAFSSVAYGWRNPCIEEVALPLAVALDKLDVSKSDHDDIFILEATETRLTTKKCWNDLIEKNVIKDREFKSSRNVKVIRKPYPIVTLFCKYKVFELQALNEHWKDPEFSRDYHNIYLGKSCDKAKDSEFITLVNEVTDDVAHNLVINSKSIIEKLAILEKLDAKELKVFSIGIETLKNGKTLNFLTIGGEGRDSWHRVYVKENNNGDFMIVETQLWMA